MVRTPVAPLRPGWVIVDGLPLFHRYAEPPAGGTDGVLVHVHGFGISGTYLEPTAALLSGARRTFVPDLPGMGRSMRPSQPLDVPGLAAALVGYLDAVEVERATLIGNSLGCPIIVEVASSFPDRLERAVLVSPAGGVNNQPLRRAVRQMAMDGLREPPSMLPIATRDYLRFGVLQSLSLFKAMTRYPTLERLPHLRVPTLVVAGSRDPLVRQDRIHVLSALPHVQAVRISGAHALNYSRPRVVADLITAFLDDTSLVAAAALHPGAEVLDIP
jgi:pimeloyl-ACP methyl ester carboxylesterase